MIPYSMIINRFKTYFWSFFYHWSGAVSNCHRRAVVEGMINIVQNRGIIELGQCRICRNVMICVTNGGHVKIGDSAIGQGVVINCRQSISIGNRVMIAADSAIYDNNHRVSDLHIPISQQGYCSAAIQIDDDVWIGTKVVILPGVHIGRGAVIGASSVITADVPAYAVMAGIPGRQIKSRLDTKKG